ncbi:hypothetical protein EPH_0009260 [Eimeria praecox]|uniref:Uncharacterized protein n=1 Tax=Eimeria praecox TaxID=51316 RepID=U6GP36_9EIME|nr:hypothetical protein EPH_0009260 [Eimeria praecox]
MVQVVRLAALSLFLTVYQKRLCVGFDASFRQWQLSVSNDMDVMQSVCFVAICLIAVANYPTAQTLAVVHIRRNVGGVLAAPILPLLIIRGSTPPVKDEAWEDSVAPNFNYAGCKLEMVQELPLAMLIVAGCYDSQGLRNAFPG